MVTIRIQRSTMPQSCPSCGSNKFRMSKVRGLVERFGLLLGYQPARCLACEERIRIRIWSFEHLIFAKCPRCHRMDLTKWSTSRYRPDSTTNLKLTFGAKPVRCEYCRCNFASWKAVKEKFSYSKRAGRSQILIPVGGGKESQSSINLGEATPAPPPATAEKVEHSF
jgi:endogenous inhibitor of DNA gyrase (YacG/DUF329 family)